ncbi:PIG-L family deacetylase [Coraliomargarita sinensis]|uniref:PIG-L family deacetylase n=1 Tax=Coraliomargarita sinensis TaxID=2174842 RepID=A0A317ZFC3_9BACT|nr:PIG-L family deacetylase [Coraliomargarita sinensis]PXA04166.1 PIG-L family deacetylase [Coraliomargarita sinensis]
MNANTDFQLFHEKADLYLPQGDDVSAALKKTTHLGVGAHQDDLEFMALHGILECRDNEDQWFGGVTCTNGAGSARQGPFANHTDEQMQVVRAEEQREAARLGQYAYMAQLDYPSSEIKDTAAAENLVNDLVNLLERGSVKVVYTHNLADKHSTHIAVAAALIKAIRKLPKEKRPEKLIGCEVWRDLDWMSDDKKVVMDLGKDADFAAKLNGLFKSQITGKRYDLAVEGRRRANATFFDSHSTDEFERVCFGMDLTPLIENDDLDPAAAVLPLIEEFRKSVEAEVAKYFKA